MEYTAYVSLRFAVLGITERKGDETTDIDEAITAIADSAPDWVQFIKASIEDVIYWDSGTWDGDTSKGGNDENL